MALLTALLLSFWSAAQAQGAKSVLPPIPDDYFLRDSTPMNVEPVTDEDNRYSDMIGPEGGQLITLDAAGNTYTLTVPKGALGFPEQLSMTPLSDLKGMPFKKGLNVGVQLEPEGTFFVKPVTLEIAFAQTPDLNTITPFNYTGKGQDFTTTMLKPDPGHFVFLLNHFSGVGFAASTVAEQTAEAVRQPLADEERIQHYVQQQLGEERQRQLLGQGSEGMSSSSLAALAQAMNQYEEQVIKPLKAASTTSCTAGVLYIQKVLGFERQKQLLGAEEGTSALSSLAGALGGPIALKCLDEETQSCYQTGDLARFVIFYLGMERQAQLLGSESMGATFEGKFAAAYTVCSHFEVQFNSTLTQKGAASLDTGLVGGTLNTDYRATITSVLPISTTSGGVGLAPVAGNLLPNGNQPLPYAGYSLSETNNSQVAVATTTEGTLGVTGNCTVKGEGTAPGLLSAYFFPAFKSEPPDPNAPDPNLEGLSPAQKRDVIRILHNTTKMGLLAPPRKLDLENSLLDIAVGQPREHAQSTCNEQHTAKSEEYTTWLDTWNQQLKAIGTPVMVSTRTSATPGWHLTKWQKQTTPAFPLQITQDTPKHEDAGGSTFDQAWHLDITVVHTPQGSAP